MYNFDNLRYVLLHCQHLCLVLSAWSNASLCRLWLSTVEKFVLHLPQWNGLFIFQYIKVFGVKCVYPVSLVLRRTLKLSVVWATITALTSSLVWVVDRK